MIIPVSDLISSAKSHCNCMDTVAAKLYYDQHDDAVIIDVREPRELDEICLDNAINIPRGLLEMKITDLCPEHDRVILVHCAGGGRASLSAYTLQTMGYSNVHIIDAKIEQIKEVFD